MAPHIALAPHADFLVRSIPDRDLFAVSRAQLAAGSEVFRDMFACCDTEIKDGEFEIVPHPAPAHPVLDLDERASTLHLLLRLLHEPPPALADSDVEAESDSDDEAGPDGGDFTRVTEVLPAHAVPLPVLEVLLPLADKYALGAHIARGLYAHLAAHASAHPLRVYGHAVRLGLRRVAARASAHLLHPPLAAHAAEEVRGVPTAEAYHALVRLHAFRVEALGEILEREEIFPHGYGGCAWHARATVALWERTKAAVAKDIRAATDVAAEMAVMQPDLRDCPACNKACQAALQMLRYKCAKVPRRIDQIPDASSQKEAARVII